MGLNKFLAAVPTDTGTNLMTDVAYAADAQRLIGHQPGTARPELANKMARQSSIVAAMLGEFMIANQALDVTDSDTPATLLAKFDASLTARIVANLGFTTGDGKMTLKTAPDTGWIMANDLSIGSATSGATGRANADTAALYTLIWNGIANAYAPVAGGRGANAAADFAANKAMLLPKNLGRALVFGGTGTTVGNGVDADVDTATDGFAVPSNVAKWITGMPVVFSLASGTITGLTSGNTYWIYRASSTLIKLCSSLANAQNGTVIDLTAKSAPVWTLTYSTAARILGEHFGEDEHAESSTELLAHAHAPVNGGDFGDVGGSGGTGWSPGAGSVWSSSPLTTATGGNAAMNNTQSSAVWNAMIKL